MKHSKSNDSNLQTCATKVETKFTISTFCCNIHFYVSLFTFILCIFLGFVCIFYGFGQITQLNVSNYWCQRKNLDTILQHSIDYNLNQGTTNGCWKSAQFTVDEASLFDTSIYSTTPDITTYNIIKCIIWLLYALLFFIIAVGFIMLYCGDFFNILFKYAQSQGPNVISTISNWQKQKKKDPIEPKSDSRQQRSSFHRCCPCMLHHACVLLGLQLWFNFAHKGQNVLNKTIAYFLY